MKDEQEGSLCRLESVLTQFFSLCLSLFVSSHLIYITNRVAEKSDKNLMTTSNLGVCFGPTLLRAEDESMSTVLDIKFANVVVEILIENCDKVSLHISIHATQLLTLCFIDRFSVLNQSKDSEP